MSTPIVNDTAVYKEEISGPRKWFNGMPANPAGHPDYVCQFYDFIDPTDISATDWTIVKDASATVAVGADADNGTVVITSNTTTDDDGGSLQSIQECFEVTLGKQLWFECKAQINDATESESFFGLSVAFATNPEAVLSAANRLGFAKIDGSTSCTFDSVSGSVNSSMSTGKVWVASTYKVLGFHWDGAGKINVYVDREYVGQVASGIPTATNMAIALYNLSGVNTGTKTATIDYVMVVRER